MRRSYSLAFGLLFAGLLCLMQARAQLPLTGAGKGAPGCPTGTSWDPGNVSTSIALSGCNLTATRNTNSGDGHVISLASHATGKYYMELTINAHAVGNTESIGLGISQSGLSQVTFLGGSSTSVGWYADGHVFVNGSDMAGSPIQGFVSGNIISMAVDMTGLVWFRTNGGNWNNNPAADPASGTGALSPGAVVFSGAAIFAANEVESIVTTADKTTANFGGNTYVNSVPSGFGNW